MGNFGVGADMVPPVNQKSGRDVSKNVSTSLTHTQKRGETLSF